MGGSGRARTTSGAAGKSGHIDKWRRGGTFSLVCLRSFVPKCDQHSDEGQKQGKIKREPTAQKTRFIVQRVWMDVEGQGDEGRCSSRENTADKSLN
jgi:hypothetical protein